MRHDADHAARAPELLDRRRDRFERLGVEAAEPFVEEDRLESDRSVRGQLRDAIRHRQRERERREERLTTGERARGPCRIGVAMVHDGEVELLVERQRVLARRQLQHDPRRAVDQRRQRLPQHPPLERVRLQVLAKLAGHDASLLERPHHLADLFRALEGELDLRGAFSCPLDRFQRVVARVRHVLDTGVDTCLSLSINHRIALLFRGARCFQRFRGRIAATRRLGARPRSQFVPVGREVLARKWGRDELGDAVARGIQRFACARDRLAHVLCDGARLAGRDAHGVGFLARFIESLLGAADRRELLLEHVGLRVSGQCLRQRRGVFPQAREAIRGDCFIPFDPSGFLGRCLVCRASLGRRLLRLLQVGRDR